MISPRLLATTLHNNTLSVLEDETAAHKRQHILGFQDSGMRLKCTPDSFCRSSWPKQESEQNEVGSQCPVAEG